MFKGTIQTMNELIAKQVMAQVEGLTLEEYEEGWNWRYRNFSSECYYESPLDAFIAFTKCFLKDL